MKASIISDILEVGYETNTSTLSDISDDRKYETEASTTLSNQEYNESYFKSRTEYLTFKYYPDLPMELALNIWYLTMLPSFVELHHVGNDKWYGICSGRSIPVISQICRASRYIFLQEYCLYLSSRENRLDLGPIYINPRIDTVSLDLGCESGSLLDVASNIYKFVRSFERKIAEEARSALTSLGSKPLTLEPYVQPPRAARHMVEQRWGIKKLALNSDLILKAAWNSDFATLELFNTFPYLEELLLLIDFQDSRCEHCKTLKREPVITFPERKCEYSHWERMMCVVGWLKASDHPDHPAHGKDLTRWMKTRVSVAMRRKSWKRLPALGVIDNRQGSELFGPFNAGYNSETEPWYRWWKGLDEQFKGQQALV